MKQLKRMKLTAKQVAFNRRLDKIDDWRLATQDHYFQGMILKWAKWKIPKPTWDHDHCQFCRKMFCDHPSDSKAIQEGYATLDEYHWICKECFNDFKELFEWEIKK